MWIGTIGNGVYTTDTQKPDFNLYQFKQKDESITTTSIRSIFFDDDNRIWFGLGTYDIAQYDRNTNQYTYYPDIPEFSEIKSMPTVYAILKRKQTNELWIGTREGIGVKCADGTGYLFNHIEIEGEDLSTSYIRKITEDGNNKIWIATNNNGIISISEDISDPRNIKYERYAYDQKINVKNIQTLLFDSKGRLWAGTEGYGLFLYNKERNIFESKNTAYNLPCDMIGSIEEDSGGCLWLGTYTTKGQRRCRKRLIAYLYGGRRTAGRLFYTPFIVR
jgi:ligand-binding sensor domain-containing protein